MNPFHSPLLTDLYQLTMLAGYDHHKLADKTAVFDLFFRNLPFQGGYAIFAGLAPALDYLETLRFRDEDIAYLASLNLFSPNFLAKLEGWRFRGHVASPAEGSPVFPLEPLVTIEATLFEAQLVETALLNIINFQTLVATKAARICQAAGKAEILEFGLRRAQGPDGALSVARASCIGGIRSTSNLLAGQNYGLPVKGTHAHSWIMAFPDELSAFRAYADVFPEHCVLLIDTYDTLKSGLPNAMIVARELREKGHELRGIRLDSGDLAWLSREARRKLDQAGFPQVRIIASNELDEDVIHAIRDDGGVIDIYGIGTRLATCAGEGGGALGGVYKLVEVNGEARMKRTAEVGKATLPGRKSVWRLIDADNAFIQDVIALHGETLAGGDWVYDPENPSRRRQLETGFRGVPLQQQVMAGGKKLVRNPDLNQIADYSQSELARLPKGSLRTTHPHRYKISISQGLFQLRESLLGNMSD